MAPLSFFTSPCLQDTASKSRNSKNRLHSIFFKIFPQRLMTAVFGDQQNVEKSENISLRSPNHNGWCNLPITEKVKNMKLTRATRNFSALVLRYLQQNTSVYLSQAGSTFVPFHIFEIAFRAFVFLSFFPRIVLTTFPTNPRVFPDLGNRRRALFPQALL